MIVGSEIGEGEYGIFVREQRVAGRFPDSFLTRSVDFVADSHQAAVRLREVELKSRGTIIFVIAAENSTSSSTLSWPLDLHYSRGQLLYYANRLQKDTLTDLCFGNLTEQITQHLKLEPVWRCTVM